MSGALGPVPASVSQPSILVVDDDRRVRELLEIALTAHGFGVLTASDGDEAVKRALSSRPDLVVLDVRLPKKSGLEVCEILRRDPDDPTVPIILVSAQSETDARLQAFSRGADDYLPKPFSPKELVARVKRLLARSTQARDAVRRAQELERELNRAREDVRRAHDESRREVRLREVATGLGRELLSAPDLESVAQRLLAAVQVRLRVGSAALLVRGPGDGPLRTVAARGEASARMAAFELAPHGELARLLAGLGRPILRAELERMPELGPELAPFIAGRVHLLAPLPAAAGLEGLLLTDERLDGGEPMRVDLDLLASLCDIGAIAVQNAQRFRDQADRLLAMAAERSPHRVEMLPRLVEAAAVTIEAARRTRLAPALRELVEQGIALGPWGRTHEGRRALEGIRGLDPSGRVAALEALFVHAGAAARESDPWSPEQQRAGLLLRVALDYSAARANGVAIAAAMERALESAGPALDPAARRALSEAARGEAGRGEPADPELPSGL